MAAAEAAPTKTTEEIRKLVPLETVLTYDRSLQVRGEIDLAKVSEYRLIIKDNGGFMDGIVVFQDGTAADAPKIVADGFHRIEAYTQEKIEKIPVLFKQGNRSDALKLALFKNGHHGAQFTNAQKRHAAGMAVVDPVIGEMSDADIAKMIGCSPSLVNGCRKGETPAQKTQKRKERSTAASGKKESESLAPRSSTARERQPKDDRPTKTQLVKQVESWIDNDVIDEEDLVKLMSTKTGQHSFVAKPGAITTLRVVGKSGRVQVEIPVVVRELKFEELVLKNEGPKLMMAETEE